MCNFKKSVRAGTWFNRSNLPVSKILTFTLLWLTLPHPRQSIIQRELNISSRTVVDWSSFCREVCVHWAKNVSCKLGGPGKIVEIDEAMFGKRKGNVGRPLIQQWIFGGVERGSTKSFFVPVDSRDQVTLIQHLHEWVLPGTTIITDGWAAYKNINREGYHHLTVNHSLNFVNPRTQAHIQTIERTWREVRQSIPKHGRRKYHYHGYLAEFQFQRAHPDAKSRLHYFLKSAAELYPGFNIQIPSA